MRNTRQNTCNNIEITLLYLYSGWRFILLVLFQQYFVLWHESYPGVREENPWDCVFFFRLLPFMIPWEKLLSWIVAPLMAKDRTRTGIYFSLLLLVWGKRVSVSRTWGITGSTQTLGEWHKHSSFKPSYLFHFWEWSACQIKQENREFVFFQTDIFWKYHSAEKKNTLLLVLV